MTLDAKLEQGLAVLGLHADVGVRERALTYIRLIAKWNRVYNLTAVREVNDMLPQHVLDSMAVVPYISGSTLVDVGSGAGLPGLPIAILCPHLRVTLLDSNHKKAAFLRQVVIELALANVEVVCERAEAWHPAQRFDVVISRAFAELAHFVALAGHLCSPDGVLIAMKGLYPEEELANVPPHYRMTSVQRIDVPGLAADRHLVLLQPLAATAASR